MAKQSSRELVLERRKALSKGGKNAVTGNSSTTANRVRSAVDARATRTDQNLSVANPRKSKYSSTPTTTFNSSESFTTSASNSRQVKRVSQPSRELVLARRKALSVKGKTADSSKDRTRSDELVNSLSNPNPSVETKYCCEDCANKDSKNTVAIPSSNNIQRSSSIASFPSKGKRRTNTKRRAIQNSSRALVLARREAQAKHGKTAGKQPVSAASVARQGDPDLTSREISLRVRELRSKSGATGTKRSGNSRPCGPNKNGSKLAAAADASWKVGVSETTLGQVVTGTQANRSQKTTGNEASTCRSITGTQYLGSEVFETFCQTSPPAGQPSKVAVTSTTHGNRVTGNEVGRSEKVTGNEPGTCKNLTGTEYISANQSNEYCGGSQPAPRKIGQSLTLEGRKVSGVMVGRSPSVTGDEAGAHKNLTGSQYLGSDLLPEGRAAEKVSTFNTLSGSGVTGTHVARSEHVTGNEAGSCKVITGDEYLGEQHYQSFCGGKPEPEASKVGLSRTNKSQSVSGTMTGRSGLVTGDEPGTCKAVTGTPYAGIEDSGQWCNSDSVQEIQQRTPKRLGTPAQRMTGQQPGIGGVMTGAEKGACETLTGTPYVGGDQLVKACGVNAPGDSSDYQSSSSNKFGNEFTVQSPAKSAFAKREKQSGVTGTSYENGNKITGPFDMAANKVTGTEQFRFENRSVPKIASTEEVNNSEEIKTSRPLSRVTGEGQSAGLNITGDDWARGNRVTGTEGVSSRRRNPTRPGNSTQMPASQIKRNEEISKPDFLITGSSGNTRDGQLVTFSGGARG